MKGLFSKIKTAELYMCIVLRSWGILALDGSRLLNCDDRKKRYISSSVSLKAQQCDAKVVEKGTAPPIHPIFLPSGMIALPDGKIYGIFFCGKPLYKRKSCAIMIVSDEF